MRADRIVLTDRLLGALRAGPLTAGQLAARCNTTRDAAARALRLLISAGLVAREAAESLTGPRDQCAYRRVPLPPPSAPSPLTLSR